MLLSIHVNFKIYTTEKHYSLIAYLNSAHKISCLLVAFSMIVFLSFLVKLEKIHLLNIYTHICTYMYIFT